MATNPANKNAVLGRSITYQLSGQGASIDPFNQDLDTQITDYSAKHVIKTMTREPAGSSNEHDQYVSDYWEVTFKAETVKDTFTEISAYQVGQARRGETVDLLHLAVTTVFADGSSRVRRYVDGQVTAADEASGKMSTVATSGITIKFGDRRS